MAAEYILVHELFARSRDAEQIEGEIRCYLAAWLLPAEDRVGAHLEQRFLSCSSRRRSTRNPTRTTATYSPGATERTLRTFVHPGQMAEIKRNARPREVIKREQGQDLTLPEVLARKLPNEGRSRYGRLSDLHAVKLRYSLS
jgi:hypothetical protein